MNHRKQFHDMTSVFHEVGRIPNSKGTCSFKTAPCWDGDASNMLGADKPAPTSQVGLLLFIVVVAVVVPLTDLWRSSCDIWKIEYRDSSFFSDWFLVILASETMEWTAIKERLFDACFCGLKGKDVKFNNSDTIDSLACTSLLIILIHSFIIQSVSPSRCLCPMFVSSQKRCSMKFSRSSRVSQVCNWLIILILILLHDSKTRLKIELRT